MNSAHLQQDLFAHGREVRETPKVKSAKTRELFNADVIGNAETAKSADPSCYDLPSSAMERAMHPLFLVHLEAPANE